MSLPNPEELRRGKKAYPTARLLLWAEEAGFQIRRPNRGTHINCRHSIHKDIMFNIIDDTKKLSSTMNLSDALVELEKRRLQIVPIAEDFAKAANDRVEKIGRLAPSYMSVEHDHLHGQIVARPSVAADGNYPEAGRRRHAGK